MSCSLVARKSALERLDWVFDYERWLIDGDTIVGVTATPDDDFLWETLPVIEGDSVRLWVSGGVVGEQYRVAVQITTAQGRRKTDYLHLRIVPPAAAESEWTSPAFVNDWADRIFNDCHLGF